METQLAEAQNRLRKAEARYDAAEKRNPDDPKLDRLYQGILNCQQLLHDLYTEERMLHEEQRALRETPAGNQLERVDSSVTANILCL